MQPQYKLIQLLADGRFHSGEDLARVLGVTRAAVWKTLRKLKDLDLELHAVSGKGYRLAAPVDLLSADAIRGHLLPEVAAMIPGIDVHMELPSTNGSLLDASAGTAQGQVCLAEQQTAGRGRRGRVWHSPFGGNLYMSFLWRFEEAIDHPGGASLAVAIGVARALEDMGITGIGLKWPNDIQHRGHKLAGILLEMTAESGSAYTVVAGIGLNVRLLPVHRQDITQAVTDLETVTGAMPPRNVLAASVLNQTFLALRQFQQQGIASLRDDWQTRDVYRGRSVVLITPTRWIEGVAQGINDKGQLLLQQADGVTASYSGGELSLRAAPV